MRRQTLKSRMAYPPTRLLMKFTCRGDAFKFSWPVIRLKYPSVILRFYNYIPSNILPWPLVASSMHPKHYRIRIFLDICRGLIGPCAVLLFVTSQANIRLGYLALPCHLLAILVWAAARVVYSDWVHSREARKLGAVPIRCVTGKWIGNVDILLNMMQSFKTNYLVDPYLDLFKEYQCTTLNLKILWVDQVSVFRTLAAPPVQPYRSCYVLV